MTDEPEIIEPWPLDPLTPEEIEEWATKIVTNVLYWPPNPDALECSFGMMLALSAGRVPIEDVGWVCEDWEEALERGVNGWPTFFSMKLVHKDSVGPLLERAAAKLRALEEA